MARKKKAAVKKKEAAGFTVQVQVVPVSGTATTKSVKFPKSGASLGEVLEAAGVSAKNKDLLLDGKPATLATRVAKEAKVQVSERPAGS